VSAAHDSASTFVAALEPSIGATVAELDGRHGTRPASQEEIADQLDLLPGDGEG
jgi:hypothetical protein